MEQMSKKKQDYRETFTQQFPAMKLRVDQANKGLTLKQSKLVLLMLEYLQQRETTLSKEVRQSNAYAEGTEDWGKRLVQNWNELTRFLSEVFSIKIQGGVDLEDRSEIWEVEYPGGKSSHKTMWEAFKAGIEASLSPKPQEHPKDCQCSECRWERARKHDKTLKEQKEVQ